MKPRFLVIYIQVTESEKNAFADQLRALGQKSIDSEQFFKVSVLINC